VPATNAARMVGVDGAGAAGGTGVAVGDLSVRVAGAAGVGGAARWIALLPVGVALSASGGASEKTKSDVPDRAPVAAGSTPELGDALSASARVAAAPGGSGRAGASVCGGATGGPSGAGATAALGGAEAAAESASSADAGEFVGEWDRVSRPALVDCFPARKATTAASTIPAATITMTNMS
jgi:hypothetical protein